MDQTLAVDHRKKRGSSGLRKARCVRRWHAKGKTLTQARRKCGVKGY